MAQSSFQLRSTAKTLRDKASDLRYGKDNLAATRDAAANSVFHREEMAKLVSDKEAALRKKTAEAQKLLKDTSMYKK